MDVKAGCDNKEEDGHDPRQSKSTSSSSLTTIICNVVVTRQKLCNLKVVYNDK